MKLCNAPPLAAWVVYSREAELFAMLHENQLLPESRRKRFVKLAYQAAITIPEWRFMRFARPLFRPGELRSLRAAMRREANARSLKWRTNSLKEAWNEDREHEPDNLFWIWKQELRAMSSEFYENRATHARFRLAEERVDKLIVELGKEWEKRDDNSMFPKMRPIRKVNVRFSMIWTNERPKAQPILQRIYHTEESGKVHTTLTAANGKTVIWGYVANTV